MISYEIACLPACSFDMADADQVTTESVLRQSSEHHMSRMSHVAGRVLSVKVLAISTDTEDSHLAWTRHPRKRGGLGHMRIPLVADTTKVWRCSANFSTRRTNIGRIHRARPQPTPAVHGKKHNNKSRCIMTYRFSGSITNCFVNSKQRKLDGVMVRYWCRQTETPVDY